MNELEYYKKILFRNQYTIEWCNEPVKKRHVNLNYCNYPDKNIGDMLSPIVLKYMISRQGISENIRTEKTYHLYAIGSIIAMGYNDATIWGSGILSDSDCMILHQGKKYGRKLDIRAVRGPLTRNCLNRIGYDCPEIYGDPAIIMPEIYYPSLKKKYPVSVIIHMDRLPNELKNSDLHIINIKTDNYKQVIDEIVSSDKVISSSLHGIILSECYGVPAIMILNDIMDQIFKFYDWYLATERDDFIIASSIRQAIRLEPTKLPDLNSMRYDLKRVFPYDLFENNNI